MKKFWILAVLTICLCAIPALADEEYTISENVTVELVRMGETASYYHVPVVMAADDVADQLYALLADGFLNVSESIDISSLRLSTSDVSLLQSVYQRAANDTTRAFYLLNTYSYSSSGGVISAVYPSYDLTDLDTRRAALQKRVDEVLALIDHDMSDVEKILAIHDHLVTTIGYNWDVAVTGISNNYIVHNAYGALVNGDAVCEGYAEAYKLILDELEIENTYAITTGHIWNVVKVGNHWYHIDATWDDPTMDLKGRCGYNNFLRSDAGITATRHSNWSCDVTCGDTTYEEGYIFNNARSSLYLTADGYYYYVDVNLEGNMILCRANALNGTPEIVGTLSRGSSGGSYYIPGAFSFAWVEDNVYYCVQRTSGVADLLKCSLMDGTCEQLATYDFTPNDIQTYNGLCQDIAGVWHDEENNAIKVVCSNCPGEIHGEYSIPDYPESWDSVNTGTSAIIGTATKLDVLQVGVMLADENGGTLCVAFYDNGKMVKIQTIPLTTAHLNVIELDRNEIPEGTTMKLFLIHRTTSAPLCSSYPQN